MEAVPPGGGPGPTAPEQGADPAPPTLAGAVTPSVPSPARAAWGAGLGHGGCGTWLESITQDRSEVGAASSLGSCLPVILS